MLTFGRNPNRVPKDKNPSEQWVTITCPVCARELVVERGCGNVEIPTVKCSCGTVIDTELGRFYRTA